MRVQKTALIRFKYLRIFYGGSLGFSFGFHGVYVLYFCAIHCEWRAICYVIMKIPVQDCLHSRSHLKISLSRTFDETSTYSSIFVLLKEILFNPMFITN